MTGEACDKALRTIAAQAPSSTKLLSLSQRGNTANAANKNEIKKAAEPACREAG